MVRCATDAGRLCGLCSLCSPHCPRANLGPKRRMRQEKGGTTFDSSPSGVFAHQFSDRRRANFDLWTRQGRRRAGSAVDTTIVPLRTSPPAWRLPKAGELAIPFLEEFWLSTTPRFLEPIPRFARRQPVNALVRPDVVVPTPAAIELLEELFGVPACGDPRSDLLLESAEEAFDSSACHKARSHRVVIAGWRSKNSAATREASSKRAFRGRSCRGSACSSRTSRSGRVPTRHSLALCAACVFESLAVSLRSSRDSPRSVSPPSFCLRSRHVLRRADQKPWRSSGIRRRASMP